MNEAGQDAHPKPKKALTFQTWRLDYYAFAVDLTIEPRFWIDFTLKIGKRVFKWEYVIDRFFRTLKKKKNPPSGESPTKKVTQC